MPDDIPVFGPSAATKGLYHQFGFSAHGFQLGPGVGALMAELIVTGAHPDPDRRPRASTLFELFHALATRGSS